MELMKELIEAAKVSRSAAHAVYHRDYVKTKKKPYRKYDPRKHASEEEEVSDEVESKEQAPVAEAHGYMRDKPRGAPRDWDAEHDLRRQRKLDASPDLPDNWKYSVRKKGVMKAVFTGTSRAEAQAYVDQQSNPSEYSITGVNQAPVKEGAFDFIKGAAQHVGNAVKQGVQNTVAAGQKASLVGTLKQEISQLVTSLATYDKLKPAQAAAPQQAPAQAAAAPQDQREPVTAQGSNPAQATNTKTAGQSGFNSVKDHYNDMMKRQMSNDPQVRAQAERELAQYEKNKDADRLSPEMQQQAASIAKFRDKRSAQKAVPDAFRTTEKPRARMGKYGPELQFSAFLQFTDNDDLITEGAWDFIKGAAGHAAGAVKQGVQNTVTAGRDASNSADLQKATTGAKQSVVQIIKLLQQIGDGAVEQFNQIVQQSAGPQARRIVSVVLASAKKMGVQLK